MNWFPVELHCHTTHSDGTFSPSELVWQAKEFGLAGIVLTDHNTVAGWEETGDCAARQGLCVLPGVEWTTYYGHMLVLGHKNCAGWMDLLPDRLDETTAKIKAQGGTVGVAHPFRLGSPVGTGCHWDFQVAHWENFGYYEVLSGENPTVRFTNHKAIATWTELLDRGYRLAPTSGIDWHRPLQKDSPYACTYVGVPEPYLTADAIQAAVAAGRTSLTLGPLLTMTAGTRERRCPVGSVCPKGNTGFILALDSQSRITYWSHLGLVPREWRIVTMGGRILLQSPFWEGKPQLSEELNVQEPWCRAELWGDVMGQESRLALTAPVYFSEVGLV